MEQDHKRRILKAAGSVGLMTTLSRILGYFRDASLAWLLGAGFGMDAFAVAYRLANLFRRMVAEGAMSAAFVPVFVGYRKNHSQEELWDFCRKFFYTLAIVTSLIVIVEIAFAPLIVRLMAPGFMKIGGKIELTIFLTRIMAPYLVLVSLTAVVMGVLNSLGYFVVPALSPIFFNISIIAAAFIFPKISSEPVVGLAFAVLVGGFLQLISQFPLAIKQGMSFRFGFSFKHEAIQKVGGLLIPTFFGIGIVQINLVVDSLMASLLQEGTVSQIYYADRIMELVLGIFVVSLTTVTLPEMSKYASENKIDELKKTILFSLRAAAFVSLPAMVGLFMLADPIVHVLFEHGNFTAIDTERTAVALAYFSLGLFSIAGIRLLVSAFYALQDTKTPVKAAFWAIFINASFDWILMHPLKQGGIALATSIASTFTLVQLLWAFQKRHGSFEWGDFWSKIVRLLIASIVMGVSCLFILNFLNFSPQRAFRWKVAALFGTIVAGIVIYLVLAVLLRAENIISLFRSKFVKPSSGPSV